MSRASSWTIYTGDEVGMQLESRWPHYNRTFNSDHPVLDPSHVCLLFRYFASGDEVLAVHPRAIVLLRKVSNLRWATFLPDQACVGSNIFDPTLTVDETQEMLGELRKALGRGLAITFLKQDGLIAQLEGLDGPNIRRAVYGTTTQLDMSQAFEAYWSSRSKSLRSSIPRLKRKLSAASIHYSVNLLSDVEKMKDAVAAHSKLELSGWKMEVGTAIRLNDAQGQYYVSLLEAFARRGGSVVYQLLYDDSVVASLLTVKSNGVQIVLKTAYDESYARLSPGRFIDYKMYKSAAADDDVHTIENYTSATGEDQRWTTASRDIVHVDYFPSSLIVRALGLRDRTLGLPVFRRTEGE